MQVTVGAVPYEITEDGQHWLVANNAEYYIGLFITTKADPQTITQPKGLQGSAFPPGWTGMVGFVRYPKYDKMWWDRFDAPQIPSTACSWTSQVEVRGILENGESHLIGVVDGPFQNGLLEGYFLPSTSPLNRLRYIFMKSTDLSPIPAGLKITVKGFSYTTGEVLNGFMVPIGDVQGGDRVYSAPTSVDFWGFTPCDFDVQYLAPESPPAYCETQQQVDSVSDAYESLENQLQSTSPSMPEIPLVPEFVKPDEWEGGTEIVEPTPDQDCQCAVSLHYIAKAIDERGGEIAGELRGIRRDFVEYAEVFKQLLMVDLEQGDVVSRRYSDEVKTLLKSIEGSLYVTDSQGDKHAFVDLVMNLVNMMSLRI